MAGLGFGDWSVLQTAEIGFRESGIIMGYFTAGYALVYLIISLMYSHALSRADLLELNASEITMTKESIWMFRCMIAIAVVVGLLAVLTPLRSTAAMFMVLIWPAGMIMRHIFKITPEAVSEVQKD